MRKIALFCGSGMSTSLLANKMKDYAKKTGYEVDVHAYPIADATQYGADADIVLLGPQVRYNVDKVKTQVSCPVDAIDTLAYGMMDGKAVIEKVKKILGD